MGRRSTTRSRFNETNVKTKTPTRVASHWFPIAAAGVGFSRTTVCGARARVCVCVCTWHANDDVGPHGAIHSTRLTAATDQRSGAPDWLAGRCGKGSIGWGWGGVERTWLRARRSRWCGRRTKRKRTTMKRLRKPPIVGVRVAYAVRTHGRRA